MADGKVADRALWQMACRISCTRGRSIPGTGEVTTDSEVFQNVLQLFHEYSIKKWEWDSDPSPSKKEPVYILFI
jgi:hypothetical protein